MLERWVPPLSFKSIDLFLHSTGQKGQMLYRLCLLTVLAYNVEPMAALRRTQQLFVHRVGKLSKQRLVHWFCDWDVGSWF